MAGLRGETESCLVLNGENGRRHTNVREQTAVFYV